MSGPLDDTDRVAAGRGISAIEVREGRTTTIGATGIVRVLPTKRKRSIGPWCFADLISPGDVEDPPPIEIGPHPHTGLATVTWLFAGAVLHTDSLGSEQLIRPGALNLMTAGRGVAHAEEGIDAVSPDATAGIMGVQLWLAAPYSVAGGAAGFEHLDSVPSTDLGDGHAHVLIGSMRDASSTVVVDAPTIAVDMTLHTGVEVPVDSTFEHGIVPINAAVKVEDAIVEPGSVAIVPAANDVLRIETRSAPARVMLLGGPPLTAPLKMWWNFVATSTDEITEAWRDWRDHNDERFGAVPTRLGRIEAPRPPWLQPP